MKKLICAAFILVAFYLTSGAQQTASKQAVADQQTKAALISKLSISGGDAEKILSIEKEFFASMAVVNAMPVATQNERIAKQEKTHDAHVIRRRKLMAVPLTGRQMEDAIELSEASRRKQKI